MLRVSYVQRENEKPKEMRARSVSKSIYPFFGKPFGNTLGDRVDGIPRVALLCKHIRGRTFCGRLHHTRSPLRSRQKGKTEAGDWSPEISLEGEGREEDRLAGRIEPETQELALPAPSQGLPCLQKSGPVNTL